MGGVKGSHGAGRGFGYSRGKGRILKKKRALLLTVPVQAFSPRDRSDVSDISFPPNYLDVSRADIRLPDLYVLCNLYDLYVLCDLCDLYDLAYVAGCAPCILHVRGHISWV